MPSAAPTPGETAPPPPAPAAPSANPSPLAGAIASTRYVALVGIVCLLVAAIAAYGVAVFKTVKTVQETIYTIGGGETLAVGLVQVVDYVLIGLTLYIFAVSLYELTIGPLRMPDWMIAHNLYELKAKLSSVIVLIVAVRFAENVLLWDDPMGTFWFGVAIALVSGVLIAYGYFGSKKD